MPDVDGWTLVEMLSGRRELVGIPVILLSQDACDLTRLRAYRLGVAEIVPKPFTVAELCIRARRLVRARRATTERVVLRGHIGEIGLGTLLSLFEVERKTGVLALLREAEVAWIAVAEGRIVRVDAVGAGESNQDALGAVLEWTAGEFEFTACEVFAPPDSGLSITRALLEHARLRDEAGR